MLLGGSEFFFLSFVSEFKFPFRFFSLFSEILIPVHPVSVSFLGNYKIIFRPKSTKISSEALPDVDTCYDVAE